MSRERLTGKEIAAAKRGQMYLWDRFGVRVLTQEEIDRIGFDAAFKAADFILPMRPKAPEASNA